MTGNVAALYTLAIGTLDSAASAMPLWWFTAISLGFGSVLALPVPLIMYVLLSAFYKSKHLLGICGSGIYVLMRVLGFIFGQIVGFGLFYLLQSMSLVPNIVVEEAVSMSYGACLVVLLLCARRLQKYVEKKA